MIRPFLTAITLALATTACQTTPYYAAMEQLGIEKRDLLVDRVEDTRGSQAGAQEAFRKALDVYRDTADADTTRLEAAYDRFDGAYDNAKDKSDAVKSDIRTVKEVASDLFAEWEEELAQYQDASLRASSQAQLSETQTRYAELERALDASAAKMDPVLLAFRDRVLFLKHNLNARSIAQLKGEEARIAGEVTTLVAELDQSIAEANRFIAGMQGGV
ncbi:MAG: DUF2959 family protein [Pacificimonas sp.]